MLYNIAFWVFLLPFFTAMDYRLGFILMTIMILIRLSANLYINLVNFKLEQFERYPLRS